MPSINIVNLSFSYSTHPLISNLSMQVGDGERACIVGPNGSGKSTLLRIVGGMITPDSGTVSISGSTTDIAHCAPNAISATETVNDYLDNALKNLRALSERFEEVTTQLSEGIPTNELSAEYDYLLSKITAYDVWALDSRIDETLAGLGLSELIEHKKTRTLATLSPGQVRRLEIAATLLTQPEVLLLDEPTNHLDDSAVAFLVGLLKRQSGPLLMASHDRAFIDEVSTVIYDLDIAPWQALATAAGTGILPGVHATSGSYRDFLTAKEKTRHAHRQLHAEQQAAQKALQAHRHDSMSIARGGVRLAEAKGMAKKFFSDRAAATSVRRTRNDDQRLKILEETEVRRPRSYDLSLSLTPVRNHSGIAVSARDAAVAGRLSPTTFDLAVGERLLVTGSNGAGKSTLLRWIMSGQAPDESSASGSITTTGHIGAVFQRLPQRGDPGITEELWTTGIGPLGSGVLHPSLWNTPIPHLSNGNQRRAQIALAISNAPDILVIDEPTNYLDLSAIEALESALFAWNGTLIVACHDRWLIEHWNKRHIKIAAPVT